MTMILSFINVAVFSLRLYSVEADAGLFLRGNYIIYVGGLSEDLSWVI